MTHKQERLQCRFCAAVHLASLPLWQQPIVFIRTFRNLSIEDKEETAIDDYSETTAATDITKLSCTEIEQYNTDNPKKEDDKTLQL